MSIENVSKEQKGNDTNRVLATVIIQLDKWIEQCEEQKNKKKPPNWV